MRFGLGAIALLTITLGLLGIREPDPSRAPTLTKASLVPAQDGRMSVSSLRSEPRARGRSPFPSLRGTAHAAFLRGRALSTTPIEASHLAIHHLERAVALDSTLGAPHSWLADAYRRSAMLGNADAHIVMPKARRHALLAIDLGERAAGRAQLAWVAMLYDWDWKLAASGFRNAARTAQGWSETSQEQSPVESWARIGEATMLCANAQWSRCEKRLRAGVWADPWYPRATYGLKSPVRSAVPLYAELLARMRLYDDAIEVAQWVLADESGAHSASSALWMAHWWRGDLENALAVLARVSRQPRALERATEHASTASEFEHTLGALLQSETLRRSRSYVSPTWIASLHAVRGDTEHSFEWLDTAWRERDSQLVLAFNMNPAFDRLRDDPRFAALARRVGVRLADPPTRRASRKVPWD